MSKSSQYPTQYPTSTGRSTGTWTCTCRVFWTGMCTWLSLEIEPQNLHLFMLRESHGALVDTSKLCWHWTPHILGKSNFGGSKFFEPYAHERQKAAEIPHFAHSEKRKHCTLRSKNEDPHCFGSLSELHLVKSTIWIWIKENQPAWVALRGATYSIWGISTVFSICDRSKKWKPVASDGGSLPLLEETWKKIDLCGWIRLYSSSPARTMAFFGGRLLLLVIVCSEVMMKVVGNKHRKTNPLEWLNP